MGKIFSLIKKTLGFLSGGKAYSTYTSAIIVAGGSSTRMGGNSKQLIELLGKPVIVHTLLAFQNTPEINEIIVVAKEGEAELYLGYKEKFKLTKLSKVVLGGETRQASAENGFYAISEKSRFVAIHDGARCLITPEEISRVCRNAYTYGAAAAAVTATDTIKIADKHGFIRKTIDRRIVWQAATPQIFNADLYNTAIAIAKRDNVSVTDDCSLAENIKHKVKLVHCNKTNIKITSKEDIPYAKAILESRICGEDGQK